MRGDRGRACNRAPGVADQTQSGPASRSHLEVLDELVQRCDEADTLLEQAIDSPVTRTDLGLPPATPGRRAAPDLFAEEDAEA